MPCPRRDNMNNSKDNQRADKTQAVQTMFTRIAPRYDLMNRLMTGGQDIAWRRQVIRLASLPPGGKLLDLGAGTGDLCLEALRQQPACLPIAVDFTLEMRRVGRTRPEPGIERLNWCAADGLEIPFASNTFDAVISGFLLRNVTDVRGCLAEQRRVLKPGGRLVALDTTPPPASPLTPLIRIHLHTIIPTLGGLITGEKEAYRYLPNTTEGFLQPEQLASRLDETGFQSVRFRRYMFGMVAIYWGIK